jgi:hypothetical protein
MKKFFIILTATSIMSCTREDLPDQLIEISGVVKTQEYLPVYPHADGMLYSIQETVFLDANGQSLVHHRGRARARFDDGNNRLIWAGVVSVQDVPLNHHAGHYFYDPDAIHPEGINYHHSGAHRWYIAGNDSFPEIQFMCIRTIPDIFPLVTTSDIIDRNESFGVTTQKPIDNADSVRYTIFSSGAYYFVTRSSDSPMHVFTPDRLAVLTPGKGILRLTAFNSTTIEINGKRLVYINQAITEREIPIR